MITIPKPCHENWADMTPKEKGRLCDKCCKVVVDFTQKTTDQIIDFLQANTSVKVCGRFKKEQITIPAVTQRRMPRVRVFMAAALFVFGSFLFTSCRSHHHQPEVMGKVSSEYGFNLGPGDTLKGDSTVKKGGKMKVCKKKEVIEEPFHLMGDVAYDPSDTLR